MAWLCRYTLPLRPHRPGKRARNRFKKMHTAVRYAGVRNRLRRQDPGTRFWPAGREGASRAEAAVRASEAHHFNVVFQAWRKVRLYEQQGDLELAQAQRIVLRERARWVAKQREEARGWRLQLE